MAYKVMVGLDIGSRFIKAVQMVNNGTTSKPKLVITEFGVKEVFPGASIPDLIKELFAAKRFKTKQVVTSISGKSVFVRYITMPSVPKEQLKEAIKYEIGKYVPLDITDLFLDCQLISETQAEGKQAESHVLFAAAKTAFLNDFINTLEVSGLFFYCIDVDCLALFNAFCAAGTAKPEFLQEEKYTVLVDVGASKTNVHIVKGRTPCFNRESYRGGDDLTNEIVKKLSIDAKQAELTKRNPGDQKDKVTEAVSSATDDIAHDIRMSIDYFEGQHDAQAERILLTGGTAQTEQLVEALSKMVSKPVLIWNPSETIERNLSGDSEMEFKNYALHSTVATGLASRLIEND